MDDKSDLDRAVESLQQLGLKEYEAKTFVALTRVPHATAREISDLSEVPRTRVYDATRVLESKGLVEAHHSNPQQFRAVSIDEAVEILRGEYESRTETLRNALQGLEPASLDDETDVTHEVWALSGLTAITSRTRQIVDDAEREVVVVIGHETAFTDDLADSLRDAHERGADVVVGTVSEDLRERVRGSIPDGEVFVSGLEWLRASIGAGDDTVISRIVLADRETILVSTVHTDGTDAGDGSDEQAVFGRGFDNGLVTIVRRLMATGPLPVDDPGSEE